MSEAIDIHGSAFKNGTATFLARIVGANGAEITRVDIAGVTYSVYLLDDNDPNHRTAVDGHAAKTLAVADVVFDAPQIDATWNADSIGYNFRHVLDVSAHQAFTVAGRRYLVEHRLTPTSGQPILVRFRVNVI